MILIPICLSGAMAGLFAAPQVSTHAPGGGRNSMPPIIRSGRILHVDATALGANDGTSWSDAYVNLQDALAAAAPGDEVWVAEGVYVPGTGPADTFLLQDGDRVLGGFAGTETLSSQRDVEAHPTVLSGDNLGEDEFNDWGTLYQDNSNNVITVEIGSTVLLDGFVIRSGRWGEGAGLTSANGALTVSHCHFEDNSSSARGGSVFLLGGTAVFSECTFLRGSAEDGGALYLATSAVSETLVLDHCAFFANLAQAQPNSPTSQGYGGAVHMTGPGTLTCTESVFLDNLSYSSTPIPPSRGGAIYVEGGAYVARSLFLNNEAHSGGGIWCGSPLLVENCVFSGNQAVDPEDAGAGTGGGVFAGVAQIRSSTFALNSADHKGGGADVSGGTFENCVLWGNSVPPPLPGEDAVPTFEQQLIGNASLRYSDVAGLFTTEPGYTPPDPASVPGSIDADPLFVDGSPFGAGALLGPVARNLRLGPGSPCIDAGDNGAAPSGGDVNGNPRFFDDPAVPDTGLGTAPLLDMGAYEQGPWSGDLPTASFAYTTSVLKASFQDLSTTPDPPVRFRLWDFGDFGYSALAAPTHRYWQGAGSYTARLIVFDAGQALDMSPPQTVSVADVTPPTGAVAAPANGATVSGTVMVSIAAQDDDQVDRVLIFAPTLLADLEGPLWQAAWDTTTTADGPTAVVAWIYDASGNVTITPAITVQVQNL